MGAELRGVQVGRATVEAPDLAWARATTETLRVLYAELAELRDEVHALAAWQRDHDKFAGVDHDSGHSVKVDAP